ncbi:MAG: hypothetical protein WCY92_06655 [Novosphingobium sp.]
MTNRILFLGLLLFAGAAPAAAAEATPPLEQARARLTPEHRILLRCSAAFAVNSQQIAQGSADPALPPSLAERGKEYFVRAGAQLMDEAGVAREEIAALLKEEAARLAEPVALAAAMPGCVASLEASGL